MENTFKTYIPIVNEIPVDVNMMIDHNVYIESTHKMETEVLTSVLKMFLKRDPVEDDFKKLKKVIIEGTKSYLLYFKNVCIGTIEFIYPSTECYPVKTPTGYRSDWEYKIKFTPAI